MAKPTCQRCGCELSGLEKDFPANANNLAELRRKLEAAKLPEK